MINTAFVTTLSGKAGPGSEKDVDPTQELRAKIFEKLATPEFAAIAFAIEHFSRTQEISDKDAAIKIITRFRELDGLWRELLIREGVERIVDPQSRS